MQQTEFQRRYVLSPEDLAWSAASIGLAEAEFCLVSHDFRLQAICPEQKSIETKYAGRDDRSLSWKLVHLGWKQRRQVETPSLGVGEAKGYVFRP